MYVYRISQNAKMLTGNIDEDHSVVYLMHTEFYNEEQIYQMVSSLTNSTDNTYYDKYLCSNIGNLMMKRYGFVPLKVDVECKYKTDINGISKYEPEPRYEKSRYYSSDWYGDREGCLW